MKASDIVTPARLLLHDADGTRWTDAELIGWINLGCLFVAVNRPDSCAVVAQVALVAGTRQSVAGASPAGDRVLDVIRDPATGRGLRLTDREVLDAHRPTWHSDASGPPECWVFDNRAPTEFWVHPPAPASGSPALDVLYVRRPAAAAALVDDLTPSDVYRDALLNYVLYRCYAKDADETHNADLASMYFQAATAALGLKTASDVGQSPDLNSAGGKITAGATAGGV